MIEDENPLAPARGILIGLLMATAFWLALIGLLLLLLAPEESQARPAPTRTVLVPVVAPERPARPEPTATVTVTRSPQPASRGLSRALSASDEAFLRCVVHRESRGNPTAQNPYSSASGLFQFIDGTWRSVTRMSGIGTQYARAKDAPSSVQWAVARWTVENIGRHPWRPTVPGTGC